VERSTESSVMDFWFQVAKKMDRPESPIRGRRKRPTIHERGAREIGRGLRHESVVFDRIGKDVIYWDGIGFQQNKR